MALVVTFLIFVIAQFLLQGAAIRWDAEMNGARGTLLALARLGTLIPFFWVAERMYPRYGFAVTCGVALLVPLLVSGIVSHLRRRASGASCLEGEPTRESLRLMGESVSE